MANAKVSVVLPVFNNQETVKDCIESFLNQSKKFDEIIVVDDGSTDKTKGIVKEFKVRLIESEHRGRSTARNIGLRQAKNEIVFFAEADAVYSKNFLQECVKHFPDAKVGGVIGKLEVLNKNQSVWTKCRAAELDSRFSNYKPFTGWMYRKHLVEKINGFDGRLAVGEDVLVGKKIQELGFKIAYEPEAVWKHFERAEFKKVLKNSWSRGKELAKYYKIAGFPKTIFFDLIAFLSLILLFFNAYFAIIFLVYLLAQLFVRRNQFLFIEKKLWIHLIVFLFLNLLAFKIGRFFGLIKYGASNEGL